MQTYDEFRKEYLSDAVNRKKLEYLRRYVEKYRPQKLLEVGSGKGIVSIELRNTVKEVHGIEYDAGRVENSKTFGSDVGAHNVFFRQGDARKLPYPDNTFDMVICSQVLEHVENPEEAIKEIVRVSKNVVIIDVPTPLWETWQVSQWMWNKIKHPSKTLRRYNETKKDGTTMIKRAFQPAHINKWSPWKWKNIISKRLEITETSACYMSPTKKFNMFRPLEMFRKSRPFKYMGMVFFIEAQKKEIFQAGL